MRYTRDDKRAYLRLCQQYNAAARDLPARQMDFVTLSIQLHTAKATVPRDWRRPIFVRECGVPD